MKKIKLLIAIISFLLQLPAFAQVSIDHPIQLTGSGANAKLTGIQQVSQSTDAVNAQTIQQNSLVYAAASGPANAYAVTLAPSVTAYTVGMEVYFMASSGNTGATTLNVNNLGVQTIKKAVSSDLASGDILNGQIVEVVYDGTNFQLISSVAGSSSNMGFSLSVSPNSVSIATNNNNASSPSTVTATLTSGTANNITYTVSGVPSGVFTTLSPPVGTPNCISTVYFTVTGSATPGTYTVTITATGGASVQTGTISLTIQSAKIVFVSSGTYTAGSLGSVAGANSTCQSLATAASLAGTYKAWISDASGNYPAESFTQSTSPYGMVNGTLIANNWTGLTSGTLLSGITLNESGGNVGSNAFVWTQTTTTGQYNSNNCSGACSNWTSNSSNWNAIAAMWGQTGQTNSGWTESNNAGSNAGCNTTSSQCAQCNCAYHLYCFQQ